MILTFVVDFDPEKMPLDKPTLFCAAHFDYVALAEPNKMLMTSMCKNLKIVDFETDHWVMLAAPDKLNSELHNWINEVTAA